MVGELLLVVVMRLLGVIILDHIMHMIRTPASRVIDHRNTILLKRRRGLALAQQEAGLCARGGRARGRRVRGRVARHGARGHDPGVGPAAVVDLLTLKHFLARAPLGLPPRAGLHKPGRVCHGGQVREGAVGRGRGGRGAHVPRVPPLRIAHYAGGPQAATARPGDRPGRRQPMVVDVGVLVLVRVYR